jgi:hypothetical protein
MTKNFFVGLFLGIFEFLEGPLKAPKIIGVDPINAIFCFVGFREFFVILYYEAINSFGVGLLHDSLR